MDKDTGKALIIDCFKAFCSDMLDQYKLTFTVLPLAAIPTILFAVLTPILVGEIVDWSAITDQGWSKKLWTLNPCHGSWFY